MGCGWCHVWYIYAVWEEAEMLGMDGYWIMREGDTMMVLDLRNMLVT